jgi:hypothetical protein
MQKFPIGAFGCKIYPFPNSQNPPYPTQKVIFFIPKFHLSLLMSPFKPPVTPAALSSIIGEQGKDIALV